MKTQSAFVFLCFGLALVGCEPQPSELAPAGGVGGAASAGRSGDSWKGQPAPWEAPAPASSPLLPGPLTIQEDFSNIPGVQEVHWMASREHCERLFKKLLQEGARFNDVKFFESKMPGAKRQGQCKLLGPGAIDNRFATDHRYDN